MQAFLENDTIHLIFVSVFANEKKRIIEKTEEEEETIVRELTDAPQVL